MYYSLLIWKRSKTNLIYMSCRFHNIYVKVIFSIITFIYIFEISWPCAILFSEGRIKIRKVCFLPFPSLENLVVRSRVLSQGNRQTLQWRTVYQPWSNLKFWSKHTKLPKNVVKIFLHSTTIYYVATFLLYSFTLFCDNCLWVFSSVILFMLMSFSQLI